MRDTAGADAEKAREDEVPEQLSNSVSLLHDVSQDVVAALSEQDREHDEPNHVTTLRTSPSKSVTVPLHRHYKSQYRGEYTGEILPHRGVQEAIKDELDYFCDRVWVSTPLADVLADPEAKIVGTRWILSNKNDVNNPDIRARLVAQEVARHEDVSVYAATPPLESKRLPFLTICNRAGARWPST